MTRDEFAKVQGRMKAIVGPGLEWKPGMKTKLEDIPKGADVSKIAKGKKLRELGLGFSATGLGPVQFVALWDLSNAGGHE